MSKKPAFGKLEIDVTMEAFRGTPEPDAPFRIAVFGDFSGRKNRRLSDRSRIKNTKPIKIDRDNFDNVLEKLGVKLNLAGPRGLRASLEFKELDDFHPDRILERVEIFNSLRDLRKRLNNSSTYPAASAEVRSWAKLKVVEPVVQARAAPDIAAPGNLLEQMLDIVPSRPPEQDANEEFQEFLRKIVEPHLAPNEDPQKPQLIACVDAAIGELMRRVLHKTDFQELEASWRALYFLVGGLETGTDLKIYLIDATKEEFADDLKSSEDLRSTGLYKLLVEDAVETPGAEPWALLIGNYYFDATVEDAEILGRIAKIAAAADAPLVSAALPNLLGCKSYVDIADPKNRRRGDDGDREAWEVLTNLPEAQYIGLALPRFLLRLPYGAQTDPVERFDFEEMPEGSKHGSYLWGNPAFACAILIGQAFSEYEWGLRPGVFQEIEGLPAHIYEEDGEKKTKPCAETLLTLSAAETILDEGLILLISFKNRDTVRVARFQSIADPLTPLAGRWS